MHADENADKLLNAVLFGSPEEASRELKRSGGIGCTGRALGAACRFRGLDMVRALVESGAKFSGDCVSYNTHMVFEREDGGKAPVVGGNTVFPLMLLKNVGFKYYVFNNAVRTWIKQTEADDMLINGEPLSASERVRSLEYLCGNAERARFVPGELLYYSILYNDGDIYRALKKRGVSGFPETVVLNGAASFAWENFIRVVQYRPVSEFAAILKLLKDELGERKLGFTPSLTLWRESQFLDPEVWRISLETFDHKRINQMKMMKLFIRENAVSCFGTCAEHGWLRSPKKCAKLLEYSSKCGSVECTAYLLELKNRAKDETSGGLDALDAEFDLDVDEPPKEPPRVWSYIKRRGDTLCVTGYNGSRTELAVPGTIGKTAVTAIGGEAFSCVRLQLSAEERERRRSVTKITLPPTIRSIGRQAFCGCEALTEVNIPEGVTEIGKNAFGGCTGLTARVSRSSYAESYCVKNKVNYIFTEVEK